MDNKRGQLGVTAGIVAVIIAIGLLIGFFVFQNIRFIIIGIALMVASLIVFIKTPRESNRLSFSLILLVVGIGFTLLPSFGLFSQSFIGGSTTLSIDRADYDGRDLQILTASLGNGYDEYVINFDNQEIGREVGENVRNDVNGRIRIRDFSSEFNLVKSSDPNEVFYQTDLFVYRDIFMVDANQWSTQRGVQECRNRGATDPVNWYAIDVGLPFAYYDLYCIGLKQIAARGDITGVREKKFVIDVTIDGETVQMDQDDNFVELHGGDVRVELVGQLESFNDIEEVPYDILWMPSQFRWLVSEASDRYAGKTTAGDFMTSFQGQPSSHVVNDPQNNPFFQRSRRWDVDTIATSLSNLNSQFEQEPLVKDIQISTTNGGSYGSQANGDMIIQTGPTAFPVVRIILDADYVGIVPLKGKPQITQCLTTTNLESGQNVPKTFQVRNSGDGDGQFSARVECSNPRIDVDIEPIGIVGAGQTRTVDALIGGLAPEKNEAGSCKLIVQDVGSGEQTSCNFNVNVEFVDTLCEPNRLYCDGQELKMCSPTGNNAETIEVCGGDTACGYNFNFGEYQCIEKGTGGEPPRNGGGQNGDGGFGDPNNNRNDCEAKADAQPYLGWTFVQKESQSCGFFCSLGLSNPKNVVESSCEARYVPYYIAGFLILIVVIILIVAFIRPRGKKSKKKKRR